MAVDEFGITMIYPTNTHPNRARPWLLGKGDWNARKFNGIGDWNDCPPHTENGHMVIEFGRLDDPPEFFGPSKGRLPVLALPFGQYPIQNGTGIVRIVSNAKQSRLRKRGFMGTINDWINVEVTAYWKLIEARSDSSYLQFTVRGGPHHTDRAPCEGIGLCVSLNASGDVIIDKEYEHPKVAEMVRIPGFVITLKDKWIGMKSVVYNKVNGNPYIEHWLDKNANNDWERIRFTVNGEEVNGIEDDGNYFAMPGEHNGCDGADNEKITWGGPGVIFKIQGINRLDLKWMSVREILPPEGFPFRSLFEIRGISFPASVRSLAAQYGLTGQVSLRELIQLFQFDNS